ncbi:RNA polymerase sigma factor [Sanguibacter sp. Leaf3]|uniref:RNA polymerase sigma factor n=1 Tax=Sanguibacter sp. Leaf3 TaxID=1736209 RepID=UPI0006FD26AC|nr:sigma-70 family RNA polymerase sigma factor [Sanguibacter sp. Leaf3]KQT99667.1 RNA polymerase subunit sigma-24 [Sanguibacter sp. Leaf3]
MDDWEHDMGELVRTRHRALLGYAYLLSGNVRDAEDLVQDALVKVFSRKSAPQPHAAEAYVRRAVYTIYLDGYRRRTRWSRVRHLTASADRQESAAPATGDQVDVAAALQRLSPRQRACVVLRYYDDLTVPQIADELGIAEGTARRHVADAHAALRGLLADLAPVPAGGGRAGGGRAGGAVGDERFAPSPPGTSPGTPSTSGASDAPDNGAPPTWTDHPTDDEPRSHR